MTTTQTPGSKTPTITTEELVEGLDHFVVVDVRSSGGYNGWRLNGEARGGHVPGSVHLPGSWLERLTDDEVRLLLSSKGTTDGRAIVLYANAPEQCMSYATSSRTSVTWI